MVSKLIRIGERKKEKHCLLWLCIAMLGYYNVYNREWKNALNHSSKRLVLAISSYLGGQGLLRSSKIRGKTVLVSSLLISRSFCHTFNSHRGKKERKKVFKKFREEIAEDRYEIDR